MKINFNKPFAIIKRKQDMNLLIFQGKVEELENLSEIKKIKKSKEKFETIIAIPFSQIKEKNFEVIDTDAKILCMEIQSYKEISVEEILKILPSENLELEGDIKYNHSDEEYENIIKNVIDEIRNGEGANFVISRKAYGKIKDMNVNKALSIFKNLLQNEIGSHWTFIFWTGKIFLIGASPETHIFIKNGKVKMHPISGTFRKENIENLENLRENFINFLNNKKEINELFMVTDEELKIMAKVCDKGGMIIGPLLKEMSALIHTEYLLSGKTDKDIIEIIKESMFAATVTGSPLENACRIIKKYEKEDRRYYSGAMLLIGKENERVVDSCILIRTVEIDEEGNFCLAAGPTIVRDSIPSEEVKETKSKMKSLIEGITMKLNFKPKKILQYFEEDTEILEALQSRNQKLSKFWFFIQEGEDNTVKEILNKKILIIDNEDGFCYMLKHMLSSMGANVKVIRYDEYDFENFADITVIGPGPGNPLDLKNKKMKIIDEITEKLINSERKFMAICLGHQFLCKKLNFKILRKEYPEQGTQELIELFGKMERVGFYNSYVGIYDEEIEREINKKFNVEISYDKRTNEIYAIRGKNFVGFQFHPESILTQNGMEILKDALIYLYNGNRKS